MMLELLPRYRALAGCPDFLNNLLWELKTSSAFSFSKVVSIDRIDCVRIMGKIYCATVSKEFERIKEETRHLTRETVLCLNKSNYESFFASAAARN